MPAYYYSSTAGSYTLTGDVTPSATILVINTVSGLPTSTPFKVVVDAGQPSEEIVKVTAVAGTSLTVVRAWDGTGAATHAAGAAVRHMVTAEDFTLSRTHEDATVAHGATGAVVGTTSAQTLSNKDLSNGTNTFPDALVTLTGAQALSGKSLDGAANTFTNLPETATPVLTGRVAAVESATADSGWVNVAMLGGKSPQPTQEPKVRKAGNRVSVRGGWVSTGLTANAEIVVGTVPDNYRPALITYINMVGSTGNQYGMAVISTSGVVSIRTGAAVADYYLFPGELNGWFTN